jgi:hypothetical protein
MMTEACIDFASRAIKELLPPQGPAKDLIEGEVTIKKIQKAKRKTSLMNWQLTVQSQEFRSELEQLLTQVPLGGAQYLKMSWDEARNRPGFLAVMIDDMYLPFAATNFYTAQRKTHVQYLTQLDYEMRVESGMYRDVDLTPAGKSLSAQRRQANDKIEGRSTPATTRMDCAPCSSATSSPTSRVTATRRTSSRSTSHRARCSRSTATGTKRTTAASRSTGSSSSRSSRGAVPTRLACRT